VNEFPGTVTRRILESRTARAVARLACFTLFLDRRHFGGDFFRPAGLPLQHRSGEDHILRHPAVTVRETHLAIGELVQVTLTIDPVRPDEDFFGFATVGATVHAQCAADRPRNATQKCKPCDARGLCRACHHHVEHCGTGGYGSLPIFDLISDAGGAHALSRCAATTCSPFSERPTHLYGG